MLNRKLKVTKYDMRTTLNKKCSFNKHTSSIQLEVCEGGGKKKTVYIWALQ